MSVSRQEEIIAALWVICSLLAFLNGFVVAGWLFGAKGGIDLICSIYHGVRENVAEALTDEMNRNKEEK
jgi:hypothetical protein